jgi:GH24 family phage-related lysozyme (muramidase)
MQSPLTTSVRGLALIRSFEKFEPKAYLCPAGKLTIGYGHNLEARGISRRVAEIIFDEDFEQANAQKPNPFAALAGLHKDKPPAE